MGVYPRVCGGAVLGPMPFAPLMGLSPRVRGSPQAKEAKETLEGSIPACAGEPWVRLQGWRSGRVYPRVCGGATFLSP